MSVSKKKKFKELRSNCVNAKFIDYSSPLGEIFRARLRQFPALVNCCTIDWFSEWPADALRSVALRFLMDIPELDTTDQIMEGLVGETSMIVDTASQFRIY